MHNLNVPADGQFSGETTSGEHFSYWLASAQPIAYNTLSQDIEADVLVIGGGLAGLTTAYQLASSGRNVVLVEDGMIGSGESGRTTAHITHALDDRYYHIKKLFGEEGARLAASSHTLAIDWIEQTVEAEGIDCEFRRVDGYLFLHPSDKVSSLQEEYQVTHDIGLKTKWLSAVPDMQDDANACIHFPDQAQFHIMKYLRGLAEALVKKGGKIYTRSKAVDIDKTGAKVNGYTVKANHIVVATNTPVNNRVTIHTKQHPYRTYVIAAAVPKGSLPFNLWWDTGNMNTEWVMEPYHYVRLTPYNDEYDLLIVGGEDHKTGQADKEDIPEEQRYTRLLEWASKRFPQLKHVVYRWSGQVMEPIDGMGFIGKNPGDDNIYIITGDSGNGMTHCTLGGLIVCDLITGAENPYVELYKPPRVIIKAASEFVGETTNMAAQYADWLKPGDVDAAKDIISGEGAIITSGSKKIAIYRDEHEKLHACSAVCTHLGCIVQWNADEKTFDCPCHGSRYTSYGEVINGPALYSLKKMEIKDE